MVQFPRSCFVQLCIHYTIYIITDVWVTPFGYPRFNGCLLLTEAFRSLPRPSSPDSSKASTMDPYSLDHIILYPFPDRPDFHLQLQLGIKPKKHIISKNVQNLNFTPVRFLTKPLTNVNNRRYEPMGLTRVELVTSRLSGVRSNRLSYRPGC